MTVQASLEVIEGLEKLLEASRYSNPDWVLHTLVPQLKADPSSGTQEERKILGRLRRDATPEEWDQLEAIAEDLVGQRAALVAVSDALNQFFASCQFAAAEALSLQSGQASVQRLYEVIRRRVTGAHMVSITTALEMYGFHEAEHQYEAVKRWLDDAQRSHYVTVLAKMAEEFAGVTLVGIQEACERRDYERAEVLYAQPGHSLPRNVYDNLVSEARQCHAQEDRAHFVTSTLVTIEEYLERYDFAGAEAAYVQVRDEFSEAAFRQRMERARAKQAREQLVASLQRQLEMGDFAAADQLYDNSGLISCDDYVELKTPYVRRHAEQRYAQAISEEQARALATPGQNVLVSARAGSGKTRVLACKIALLIECEHVDLDQILVMAFNRSAADEIRDRIQGAFKQPRFRNARTFHSLAHQLVDPRESLLYDVRKDVVTRKLTLFVQERLRTHLRDAAFSEVAYTFFREEMCVVTQAGSGLPDEAYLQFRRNLRQVTLRGERVKSAGEKYIADYLFEHDIPYTYEKTRLWCKRVYRPDFTVFWEGQERSIEHWGIDEHDPAKHVPPEWRTTWDEYYSDMQRKRRYWEGQPVYLIETSISDLRSGREAFEAVLETTLTAAGLGRPKLTAKELQRKLRDKDGSISRLAELFVQFIQRAKKKGLQSHDMRKHVAAYHPKDGREGAFLRLACEVYASYEQALKREATMDFDDLLKRGVDKIRETHGECRLPLDSTGDRSVRMTDLRWILIDEYQDFSELFCQLVNAIRAYNPKVRLFCVGDDWQAINGFAGSDLYYFKAFGELFERTQTPYLLDNYRSQAAIVEHGNALMEGYGRPGRHLLQKGDGEVSIAHMDAVWVELRNGQEQREQRTDDEPFWVTKSEREKDAGTSAVQIVASKYLKECHEIIMHPRNAGKHVAILCRTNWIDSVELRRFKECLIASFSPDDLAVFGDVHNMIDVQTVHKYKGREADVVIILRTCDGQFPLLHPDNELFGIFGTTLRDAFDEERRLFYVALTRARESLYLLTEEGRESVFLEQLPVYRGRPETTIPFG